MPLIGFKCSKDNQNRKYDYCIKKCQDRCEPLPILLALMQDRKVVENTYGVTEILNPPQIVYYQRNFPYYATPESLIWMGFGSGFHAFIESSKHRLKELGLEEEHQLEVKFKKEFDFAHPIGIVTLKGRVDLYQPKLKRLWDFKTLKAYAAKKLKQGKWKDFNYHTQMNIYRYYGFPDVKEMYLEALVKDWSERIARQDNLKSLEQFKVPDIPKEEVTMFVELKLIELVKNQQNNQTIIPCSDEETWHGRRCKNYCSVSSICPTWRKKNVK